MMYIMKAGTLYHRNHTQAQIKGILIGPQKQILSPDGTLLLQTDIRKLDAPVGKRGDVRFREYLLSDMEGNPHAIGKPDYTDGDDPAVIGWPICRMPKVDHAQILIYDNDYLLVMRNSRNYQLQKHSGEHVLQICHRGLGGGWDIETEDEVTSEMICGIFIFCRYMEQENEFLIV